MPETITLTIPGYTIENQLGHGGMATVYLAIQESFGRQVALKVMSPALSSDPTFASRFMREARIVAVLSHASIVPVFEVGEHDSVHYLSMEYLPAGDLKTRIDNGERGPALAVEVCMAICSALDMAHRKGFVHRDIKPENILFREDGTPVLTDFGIARAVDRGRSLTSAGMMVGTPSYMSPEQVRGSDVDGRADLYAVGVVFYETLTGELPFQAETSMSMALKHISDPLPPLPAELSAYQGFLDRLTAKDADARFATGAEVIQALRQLTGQRNLADLTLIRPRAAPPLEKPPPARKERAARPKREAARKPDPAPNQEAPRSASPRGSARADASRKEKPEAAEKSPRSRPARASRQASAGALLSRSSSAQAPAPARLPPAPPAPRAASGRVSSRSRAAVRTLPPRRRPPRRSRGLRWLAAGALTALATVGAAMMLMGNPGGAPVPAPSALTTGPGADRSTKQETAASVPAPIPAPPPAPSPTPGPAPVQESVIRPAVAAAPVVAAARPSPARTAPSDDDSRRRAKAEEQRQVQQRAARLDAEAKASRIRELLGVVSRRLAAGALWQPAGGSVADSYRTVLQLQPGQPEAQGGARRLAGVLVEEAQREEAVGDIYTATQLIAQIRSLQPDHPKLRELQERLKQLQTRPATLDAHARSHLERAAIYLGKARDPLGNPTLDARAVEEAAGQYDNAMSEEPKAPGLPSLRLQLAAAYALAARTELSRHDARRARKLIATARKRGWSSTELDRIDAEAKAAPGET